MDKQFCQSDPSGQAPSVAPTLYSFLDCVVPRTEGEKEEKMGLSRPFPWCPHVCCYI